MNIKQELNDLLETNTEEHAKVLNRENKDIIDRIEEERLLGRNMAYQLALSRMNRKLYSLAENERRCKSATEKYGQALEMVPLGEMTLQSLAFDKGQAEGFADVHALLEAEESNR